MLRSSLRFAARTARPVPQSFAPRRRFAIGASQGDVVGIDCGTTSSCVGIIDGKQIRIIENSEGVRTTPSVVAITPEGEAIVGTPARRQQVQNPASTFFSFKRIIGRRFDDPIVRAIAPTLPYKVVEGPGGAAFVEAHGKRFPAHHLTGHVLAKMRLTAEETLGRKVENAVITVPAHFSDAQRQATKDAARMAGLTVRRFISEPTAAALAYALDKKEGTIAVYDLGGGTFDFSLLSSKGGVIEVKATGGDPALGGVDADAILIEFLLADFERKEKTDLRDDPLAVQRVREQAERAKVELAHSLNTTIYVPFITADAKGPKHLQYKISRSQHDVLLAPLLDKTFPICEAVMKDAGVSTSDIESVVLVGGSTKWPKLHERVEAFFGRPPEKEVNADEVVAAGAAAQGGVLKGVVEDVVLLDITPLSLGVETEEGVVKVLLPRYSTLPARATHTFTTSRASQDSVKVRVVQGEHLLASECHRVCTVELAGLPPAPVRGAVNIDVHFEVDTSGVLTVTVREPTSGLEQSTVASASAPPVAAVAEDDEEGSEKLAPVSTRADEEYAVSLASARYTIKDKTSKAENALRTFLSQASPKSAERLRAAVIAAEEAAAGEDIVAMRRAAREMQWALLYLSEDVYAAQKLFKAKTFGLRYRDKALDAVERTVRGILSPKPVAAEAVAAAVPAAAEEKKESSPAAA